MALPFLRGETEENATQSIAFIAIVAITVGLAIFNVIGVILGSEGKSALQIIARGAAGLFLVGAEFLAAVALVRVMLAKNRLRKVIGTIIFLGLAWACIQNGKRTAHDIFPEFAVSASLLEAQSGIASKQAGLEDEALKKAIAATPEELSRVRTRIATLEGEQQLMASQSPEKIAEAQAALIAQGKYYWEVDGVRGPETERAMRARGEEIRIELENLRRQETNLATGVVSAPTPDGTPNSAAPEAATKADQAQKAREAAIWIEVMLWVLEGARSFGLWALVTTITAKQSEEDEAFRRNSERAKKGWETRREKDDVNKDDLQIDDKGYWETRVSKAVNTGYKVRKIEGMCQTYFGTIEPGQLREHLKRQIDAHLELPKADTKKHKRAIERGLLSDERKTYLMQDHIDFIFSEGAWAPKAEEEPKQEVNGIDHQEPQGAPNDDTDDTSADNLPAPA